MLMLRQEDQIISGSLGVGNNFSIAASTKAFEILSNSLYQNKTLAVIREITCNAVDAHTVAGLPIRDIQVHLPTYMEPVFWVRDYGSGLSEDDVLSLYTTYFRSTKDQDNSQIGGFGLGSKSPFAVADQFTVTSWHGGEKRTYVCYKQDGLPRVNHVGTEPCGTETGIEVRVPVTVRSGGFHDWQENAGRLFQWWSEAPTCNLDLHQFGIAPDVNRYDADYEEGGAPAWSIFDVLERSTTVIMGNVPYRLEYSGLPGLPEPALRVLTMTRLVLRVPMGSVSISPSRETLSYDATTIKYLTGRLPAVLREIKAAVEKEIAAMPTLSAARAYVYGVGGLSHSGALQNLRDHLKLEWNGKPIKELVALNLRESFAAPSLPTVFDYTRQSHWTNFRRESYGENDLIVEHRFPRYESVVRKLMWTAKVTSAVYAKLKHAYPKVATGKREDIHLCVVSGVPFQDLVDKCLEIGIPAPINIDTALAAPPPSVTVASGPAAPKTKGYVFNPADYSYNRTTAPIDLAGGGIYLEFVSGEPSANYIRVLRSLRTIGYLGVRTNPRIIGLSKAGLDKSKNLQDSLAQHGWVRFDPSWVAANVPEPLIEEYYRAGAILNWLMRNDTPRPSLLERVTWKGFDSVLKIISPYLKRNFDPHAQGEHVELGVMLSDGQLKAKERGRNVGRQLSDEWGKFLDMHPMLRYIRFDNIADAVLNDYVNR